MRTTVLDHLPYDRLIVTKLLHISVISNLDSIWLCSVNAMSLHPLLVTVAGCENSDVCPFEVFKERIAIPHLKHDYTALCNMESDQTEQTASVNTLSQMLGWLFPVRNSNRRAHKVEL
ncbi:multiple inositol polyphosphate phosphatase 1-like [Olea europaea subsp. europaea]|uniref:Multiple inositol polyphosphate phosphatase 1-like n=1 Tax=Olea europaea subsp. europaea TaxID=158383 RepID=A0A8S0RQS6_OLEEU|nr:multiple inositol polyphosphate phosphatase 1-like [Olea europaea subsp. europaea]